MHSSYLGPGDFLPTTVFKNRINTININRLSGNPFKLVLVVDRKELLSEYMARVSRSIRDLIIVASTRENNEESFLPDFAFASDEWIDLFRFPPDSKLLLINVGRNLRVNELHEFPDTESLLDSNVLCSFPDRLIGVPPVSIIPQVLSEQLSLDLIEEGLSRKHKKIIYQSIHKSRTHIVCSKMKCEEIDDILSKTVFPEAEKAFACEINQREPYKICVYDSNSCDFLADHRDSDPPYTHRRLGLSITLNTDYKGGELIFPEYQDVIGVEQSRASVVFSGRLMHRINPVTMGSRWSLVTFLFNRIDQRIGLDYSDCEINK